MPRFRVRSAADPEAGEVEAANWIKALGKALQRFGLGGTHRSRVVCDLDPDGGVQVSDPDGGVVLTMSELTDDGVPQMTYSLDDDPTNELWDPPDPAAVPAFADRETQGEIDLERVTHQAREIGHCVSTAAACELALDILMSAVPAESASILLVDGVNLRFAAVRGPRSADLQGIEMPCNEGIAGVVISSGTSLLVREVDKSRDHYREVDRWVEYQTRTLMAVPVAVSGRTLGVLELLNPFGHVDFADWHQQAASEVGRQLGARIGLT